MATFFHYGSPDTRIDTAQKERFVRDIVQKIVEHQGVELQKILLLPPDMSRFYSGAGEITQLIYKLYAETAQIDIMPAIGTHFAMTEAEIREMFGAEIPLERFKVHDWRNEVKVVGEVPADKIREFSEGAVEYPMEVGVNKWLIEGHYDLILSIGQIVPHEVIGLANFTKNVCVGVGGSDMINKSHFLGAVYGMEKIMGRADTPVRRTLDYAFNTFLGDLPIFFIMTVMEKQERDLIVRGLYASDKDNTAFLEGAELCQQVNLDLLDTPLQKVVVYLDPTEFKSTWIGNKSIYRTRMAMADGGELIILAPGLKEFGEDPENGRLIRKYGYHGLESTLKAVEANEELRNNLGAAAHLIHGCSEGRFNITYCPSSGLTQEEIESVGYAYAAYEDMRQIYNPDTLEDGWNTMPDGEKIFYVSNPALGLWALKEQFEA
jgi:nickel-dependent lactate racemase